MTVSGRRIEVPDREVTFYLPGNGRTCDIHDQLRSLQNLCWPRSEVLKEYLHNST